MQKSIFYYFKSAENTYKTTKLIANYSIKIPNEWVINNQNIPNHYFLRKVQK